MAKHIAYLFIRDPLILFNTNLEQDPETDTDHYEVIACDFPSLSLSLSLSLPLQCSLCTLHTFTLTDGYSTQNMLTCNWQSLRFKIPKHEIDAGWRVEVRTMDVSAPTMLSSYVSYSVWK